MSVQHLFLAGLLGSSLLTGCMTSENWIDDDVYVMKPAEVPIETDISDETDYNAYVYNQRQTERKERYYSDYYTPMVYVSPYSGVMYYGGNGYNSSYYNPYHSYYGGSFGNGYYGSYSPYGPYGYDPYYGYSGYYSYNPYGYSPYGYNPYYGYGNSYGYNPYGGGYGGSSANHNTSGNHFQGPRGSSAGMGGVSSRSSASIRSSAAPSTGKGATAGVPASGREGYLSAKPVTSSNTAGRTDSRVPQPVRQPSASRGTSGNVSRGSGTTEAVRPPSSTGRTTVSGSNGGQSRSNGPERVSSPSNSGSGRNSGTTISAPARTSSPAPSSGSSGGSSRGGSSGGSSGGASKPGRP